MHLKKLSLQGFKSFAPRTTFDFGPGVTAVVGPNGSGKSNVADAIRWVLGEQSSRLLRAKKQEDVIFSGTKDRPAVGMAEAILTLDNTDQWLPLDFAEVEVGRRVYRNGDSEYLLNGSRVRLRDIVDLLVKADVGQNSYAIMGQGLVDEVLSMSPDERRVFLDEAADVKRFRSKIREAQDRLAATRENMDRVEILVGEIEPRLSQLSRQAERAGEQARLAGELGELLRAWYGHRWSEAQNTIVRARAGLDQRIAEDATAIERVDQLREQLKTLGEEIRKRREAIARRDLARTEMEQRLVSTEQAMILDRERHAMITGRREEVQLEIEALEAERLSLSSTDLDEGRRGLEVAEEIEQARGYLAERREALEVAEREYSAIRSRAQELTDSADNDDERVAVLRSDKEDAQRRLVELQRELEQGQARRKATLVEMLGHRRDVHEARVLAEEAQASLDVARREAEDSRERLLRMQEEVRQYEASGNDDLRELDRLEGRLEALRRVQVEHEGVASGTRAVLIMGQALIDGVAPGSLGEAPEIDGVHGLISRRLKVPVGLEAAINAALEHRLHAVVVAKEADALQAIELLRTRSAGRAQFLPLESVRHVYPLNLQKERGVVGVAAKMVRCDAIYRPLVDTLLGRVIICEDAQTGLRMVRRGLGSVVTLDGTFIEQSGVISGGATGVTETLFSRNREMDELPKRIEELRERTAVADHQLSNAQSAIDQMAERSKEAEAAYAQLRREVEGARAEVDRRRSQMHRLRRELAANRAKRLDILREQEGRTRLIAQAEQAIALAEARRTEREEGLGGIEARLAEATEKRDMALRSVAEASGKVASIEGERRTLDAMREQHERAIERLANQVSAKKLQARNLELEAKVIDERLAKLSAELETIRAQMASQGDDAAPDRDELNRLESHERTIQEEFTAAQSSLLEVERRRLDVEAEMGRAEDHLESLRTEMEREGLAPNRRGEIVGIDDAMEAEPLFEGQETRVPPVQGAALIDVEETRDRIDDLRRQIRRLGPINEEAPSDYEESKERYEFLTAQLADLEEADAQLREAIAALNEEVRARFSVTFERVNTSFGEYFSAFFGGGQAKLMLADPDNIAESGIEIEAQPPGKRINSLTMLSGGERSLTAVALLFALLTANPAPFCVLDEVDAALDEANVGRFTQALERLAEQTQFIVVTHNRRTIEVADDIFGVSMGRDGVSKVLSLRLSDIPQK